MRNVVDILLACLVQFPADVLGTTAGHILYIVVMLAGVGGAKIGAAFVIGRTPWEDASRSQRALAYLLGGILFWWFALIVYVAFDTMAWTWIHQPSSLGD